jgi:hypothetical protein
MHRLMTVSMLDFCPVFKMMGMIESTEREENISPTKRRRSNAQLGRLSSFDIEFVEEQENQQWKKRSESRSPFQKYGSKCARAGLFAGHLN